MLKAVVYWFVVGSVIELINFYFSPLIIKTVYNAGLISNEAVPQMNIGAGVKIIILIGVLSAIFAIIYQLIFVKK